MVRELTTLRNLGLFRDATASGPIRLERNTLIYGENGRGKSTLAAVFRSCASGDPGAIQARRCIDSAGEPEVGLLWDDIPERQVRFSQGEWSEALADILVFDAQFVDENVYSGLEVTTQHRQSLLEFALGEEAVRLKGEIERCAQAADLASRQRRQILSQLAGHASPYTAEEFVRLTPPDDIAAAVTLVETRISALKHAGTLLARRSLVELTAPSLDLDALSAALGSGLAGAHEAAEAEVRAHLAGLGQDRDEERGTRGEGSGILDWLAAGTRFHCVTPGPQPTTHNSHLTTHDSPCPYCGQDTTGISLVQAYRVYFDQEYGRLKDTLAALRAGLDAALGPGVAERMASIVDANGLALDGWKPELLLPPVDFPAPNFAESLAELRTLLTDLCDRKQANLFEPLSATEELARARHILKDLSATVDAYNAAARQRNSEIASFKESLAQGDLSALERRRQELAAQDRLFDPEVVAMIAAAANSDAEHSDHSERKRELREEFNHELDRVMGTYSRDINNTLERIGAEFRIIDLRPNHAGGRPGSDYGLFLRSRKVRLGNRAASRSAPAFGSTLSDGDRRCLAFAFFIARLRGDTDLGSRVVVVDDPVTNLDALRKKHVLELLAEIAPRCAQMVVLSHDAPALRDLRRKLAEAGMGAERSKALVLVRGGEGYTEFRESGGQAKDEG